MSTILYDLGLAWRGVRARLVQALIPLVVVALGVAVAVATLALGDGVRRGIIQASDPFGVLVVGAKGDGQQLVLNSVLLQGLPLGTIPASIYDELVADPRVRLAVPLAKGDNVGGAPVIGTDAAFFQLRPSLNAPLAFRLSAGRLFDADFEAVLGSTAAEGLGLQIGDQFQAQHGFERGLEDDTHAEPYTVVGILHPSGTAYDSAVYVTTHTVWDAHAEEEGAAASPFTITGLGAQAGDPERLTSVLVQPVGFAEANTLWQTFYTRTDAQAAFPGQELGRLFDLFGQVQALLTAVGWLVLAIALAVVFLSAYGAALHRRRDLAVMRSLGAPRGTVARVLLFEALLVSLGGALLGRLIGYGAALVIGAAVTEGAAIPVPVEVVWSLEPVLWVLPLVLGGLGGLIPAWMAYRADVVEGLAG